jgi:formiminotetrahydrofolate cyclodeaminase
MGDEVDGFASLTLDEFTRLLASAEPVPGGGSAAAVAASLAASLTSMVARLSGDRPRYAAYAGTHARSLVTGDTARRRFLELADDDARAYAAYGAARRLPRDTPAEQATREAATRSAARLATEVPLETARLCVTVIECVERLAGRCNVNASSDLDVAASLTLAAARSAAANVLVNLRAVEDAAFTEPLRSEVEGIVAHVASTAARVHEQVMSVDLRAPEPA